MADSRQSIKEKEERELKERRYNAAMAELFETENNFIKNLTFFVEGMDEFMKTNPVAAQHQDQLNQFLAPYRLTAALHRQAMHGLEESTWENSQQFLNQVDLQGILLSTVAFNDAGKFFGSLDKAKFTQPANDFLLKKAIKEKRSKDQEGLGIGDFLILPIQRLPRYSMLAQQMEKNTLANHAESAELVARMTHRTKELNEAVGRYQNLTTQVSAEKNKKSSTTAAALQQHGALASYIAVFVQKHDIAKQILSPIVIELEKSKNKNVQNLVSEIRKEISKESIPDWKSINALLQQAGKKAAKGPERDVVMRQINLAAALEATLTSQAYKHFEQDKQNKSLMPITETILKRAQQEPARLRRTTAERQLPKQEKAPAKFIPGKAADKREELKVEIGRERPIASPQSSVAQSSFVKAEKPVEKEVKMQMGQKKQVLNISPKMLRRIGMFERQFSEQQEKKSSNVPRPPSTKKGV